MKPKVAVVFIHGFKLSMEMALEDLGRMMGVSKPPFELCAFSFCLALWWDVSIWAKGNSRRECCGELRQRLLDLSTRFAATRLPKTIDITVPLDGF